MPFDLDKIKTVVIVMMENRSFDHLFGYLSLNAYGRTDVDGLKDDPVWMDRVASVHHGVKYPPHLLADPYDKIAGDPPHERDPIAVQMGASVDGVFPMNGFVDNYVTAPGADPVIPGSEPPVMGYFTPKEAPVTSFFADNFAICDHWFSSLPAGTQPNRLIAMSGFTDIDVNQKPLPNQTLVYDWLTERKVRWRVYHESLPFYAMMLRWIPEILTGDQHFRPKAELYDAVEDEPPTEFPQVIFIEPTYTDAPHIGVSRDDHAPSGIKGGQEFLLEAYRAMTRVPEVWAGTVMIVTYDEHGGFFDHVSPPQLRTDPSPTGNYPRGFDTLGVRVPGIVISPFVKPGTVYKGLLDHTSILKFLGEKFGNGSYSELVDKRPVGSISDVLNEPDPTGEAPIVDSMVPYLAKQPTNAGFTPGTEPQEPIPQSFLTALETIRVHPDRPTGKFSDLLSHFPPRPDFARPTT